MSEQINNRLDELEAALAENFTAVDCHLDHKFVGGMYIRTIFMPKGTTIVSMIHNQDNPFFVLKGKAIVYDENNGEHIIEAPFNGITKKGTRRVLYIEKDCVWSTVHITDIKPTDDSEESIKEAVSKVVQEVTENRDNHILGGRLINNEFIPNQNLIT